MSSLRLRLPTEPETETESVARTSICAFAELRVATLFSLFVLKDAPLTSLLVAGAGLVLCAIAVSARSSGE